MKNNLKITLQEFNHIHNTINSVYNSDLKIDLDKSAFFSIFAAAILKNHFNFNTVPVCGDYLVYIENDKKIEYKEEKDTSHCLVIADGWFFDFTSPFMTSSNKKMIQKRGDKINIMDAKKEKGYMEFWHIPTEMEKHLIKFNRDDNLKELCVLTSNWFNKKIHKMNKNLIIVYKDVEIANIELLKTNIVEKF